MTKWIPVFLLCILFSCKNSQEKAPETLAKDEMPANIRQLFAQTAKHPDSVGLRLQLVDALDSIGAYPQAIVEMESLIRKDSLNYAFWYRKALVQQSGKDTIGALQSFRYAIRVYPAPDALLAAANLLAERKDTDALSLTAQVSEMHLGRQYDAHTHFINGVYFARTRQTKKAMDAFNTCIYNDLNYMEAYMEKGFLYFNAKKIPEAIKVFQSVVSIKTTYADGYYWLAKCQEILNNRPEAIANYKTALQLDPAISEAGEALKRLGAG